jgi:hypothetical protein
MNPLDRIASSSVRRSRSANAATTSCFRTPRMSLSNSIPITNGLRSSSKLLYHARYRHAFEQGLQQHLNYLCQRKLQYFSTMPQRTLHQLESGSHTNTSMAELESIPLTKQQKRLQHLHEFEVAHQKRKINRMKRMAEEWIMMCESSENLFRATLKEMGVDPKIWEKLGLRIGIDYSDVAEYKKLYLESLPSFQEWMIERIDGLHDEKVREDDAQFIEWMERCRNDSAMQEFQQFYSDPTPSIEYSLEKVEESNKRMDVCLEWLGESAFVDTKFQKKYRKMNKSLNLEEQLRGHYRIEMERCARSMKDFEREDFALMRLQYQREAGLAASSSPDGTSSKGNIANDKLHQWVIKNSTKLIEKQQKKTGY